MSRLVTTLALATLVAAPAIAHADDGGAPITSDRRDHSRIAMTLGVATPTGGVGLEYTLALHQHLDLALGVGLSTTSVLRTTTGYGESAGLHRADPQAAVMARYRLRTGMVTYSGGAGLSAGRYQECHGDLGSCETIVQTRALWANLEAGVQLSSASGPFVRFFVGTGYMVVGAPMDTLDGAGWLPYAGASVGYAL